MISISAKLILVLLFNGDIATLPIYKYIIIIHIIEFISFNDFFLPNSVFSSISYPSASIRIPSISFGSLLFVRRI